MYYRNLEGRRRRLDATAGNKAAARRALLLRFEEVIDAAPTTQYATFRQIAEDWHRHVDELAAVGHRSPTTAALYRQVLDRHVLPALGALRPAELTPVRVDHFLQTVRRRRGYPVAKLCRSITSGVCGFAVRRGAMRSNPVRDVGRMEGHRRQPRALTPQECRTWLRILDADAHARAHDLPDLTRFLLGTGVRLGEALGVHWEDVDFTRNVIHIRRTVVRVEGRGLITKAPKSQAGVRVLPMPTWLVHLLRTRRGNAAATAPVFPDSIGGYRDRNNVERAYRRARAGTPFEWVVPHTYRKTVATLLDHGGLTARTIADQLGHARVSMTQDVYIGRGAVQSLAATALEDAVVESDEVRSDEETSHDV